MPAQQEEQALTTYRDRLEAGVYDPEADKEAVDKKLAAAEKKRLAASTTSKKK